MFSYKGVDSDYTYKVGTVEAESESEAVEIIKEKENILIITSLTKESNFKMLNNINSAFKSRFVVVENRIKKAREQSALKKLNKQDEVARVAKEKGEEPPGTSMADRSPVVKLIRKVTDKYKGKSSIEVDEETREQLQLIFKDSQIDGLKSAEDDSVGPKVTYNKPVESNASKEGKEINWDLLDSGVDKSPDARRRNKLKVKNKEIIMFTRRLHIMLSSGVPLLSALTLTRDSSSEDMAQILTEVIEDINMGSPFSGALSKFPNVFNSSYISLISIGETTGEIDSSLIDIIKLKEQEQKVKKKVKTASIYPSVVGVVLTIMMIGATVFFLPRFEEMYEDQGLVVPLFTEVVFSIAGMIPLIALTLVVLGLIINVLRKRIPKVNQMYIGIKDRLLLKIPVVKDITSSLYMYHFSSTVSLMLKNGIRLSDTLELAGRSINNIYIRNEIESVGQLMIQGLSFSEALESQAYFEDILINITKTGEESGRMVFSLTKIAEYYETELNNRVDSLMEIVPPMSIVLIAVIAAPVIIAAYLPILEMSSGSGIEGL